MLLTVAANLSAFAFQADAPPEINESLPAANDAPAANNSANQTSGNQASANRIAIELRVVWGGGAPRAFQGNISIDKGSIKLVRNLSLQSDSIGSIVSAGTSTLKVIGHSASTFGGADVSIEGGPTSRVTLRFVHPTTNQPIEHSFLVNEVLNDRWLRKLDEQGNRLAAERQVQDRLRVRSSQPQGIFHPDYVWTGSVSGYLSGLQAGEYQLQTRLLDQNAGDAVVSEQEQAVTVDERGDFNTSSLQVPLPHTESSYALEFSLHRKRFLQTFVSSPQVLKRRLDLVVFDYALPPKRIEYWSPVATIQPLNSQWWSSMDWMPTLGAAQPLVQIPSFNEHNKRLVNHGPQSSRKVGEDDCLVLGPSAWQAYPLTIEHPGQPHRLRIRLPRDQAQQLIISIRDSHSNGEPTTLNIDSGVVIGERQAFLQSTNSAGGSPWIWADHEIVFWPRSSRPTLLMLNGSSTEEAAFGDLQLDVGQIQAKQPATPAQNELNITDPHTSERMVALYLTKPLIADAFGAHRSIDPVTKRALDSWLTWQQSAERLSLHMQNAGYNTLILNVAGDGGSVLPLSRLASTTRFDNGTFFSDGRSPEIKDFVELLCRHFDRAGLKLILAVDLNAHLPGLARWEAEEAKRVELQKADSQKASPQNSESKNSELKAAGLFQVNLDGKPWQLDSDSSNRRVLYNPLHSQVQTEIEQIVRELSTRYSSHQSFKGLALDLGEASHLVFAGDRWGYDESTLKKFESATQSRLPARDAMPAAMQGGLRLAYLNWRARALSTFYVRLADTLRNAKPDAKLLLNPISLWQRQPSQHEYMDSLATSRNLSDTLLWAGVDVGWLKQHEHIAVLRGQ
ncbi:MAG: family 10 glycosylhydrolase, partial [Pirellulaceae bacterium]|nr:family 10 glycosylhydrolase [Pirellulaceae bacterium]